MVRHTGEHLIDEESITVSYVETKAEPDGVRNSIGWGRLAGIDGVCRQSYPIKGAGPPPILAISAF